MIFHLALLRMYAGPWTVEGTHDGYRSARSNSMRPVIEVMYQRPLSFFFFLFSSVVVVIPRRSSAPFPCRPKLRRRRLFGRKQMIRNKSPCFVFVLLFFSFYLVEEEEATRHFNNNRLSLWCVLHRKVYVHIEKKKKKTRISPPVVFIQCMNYWWWKTRVKRWIARTCVWNLCICIYNRVEQVFFSFPFDGLFHTAASGDDGRGRRNSCWISIPNSSRTAVALLRVERNP